MLSAQPRMQMIFVVRKVQRVDTLIIIGGERNVTARAWYTFEIESHD